MMFNIFATNTYRNGSNYIYDLLSKTDPKQLYYRHIVIVPDRASMSAEEVMLQKLGGSFNVQVLTFRRFANQLLPHFEYLSKQSGLMALTAIVEENKGELTCFTKGVNNDGFIKSVYDTICQLKYSRITPKNISETKLPEKLKAKINDIQFLYGKYEEFLQYKGNVDSAGKLEELISRIQGEELIKNSYFYIYDFDNFSKQELAIIEELIKYSMGVTLACCYSDKPQHKYLYINDVYKDALALAKRCNVEPKVVVDDSLEQGYRRQVGEYLYTYYKTKPIQNEKLNVVQTSNINQEVTSLAQYIVSSVRKGCRYGDFYVVSCDASKYRQAVERIFADYDIPYFMDTQIRLNEHIFSQYVLDYLAMYKNNFKLDSVLNFVKNPFFDISEDVFRFENYCLKYNAGFDFSSFDLGKNEDIYASADKLRAKLFTLTSNNVFADKDSVSNYVDAIYRLIESQDMKNRLEEFANAQIGVVDKYAKATNQVYQKFCQTLDTMTNIFGNKVLGLDEFIKILSTGISGVAISVLPLYNDCVVITNMAKSKKHNICKLALLGANQTAMPIVKKDTKLLSDNNILELGKCGLFVDQSMILENKRERFNVYQLLLETDDVYISYLLGSDEQGLIPSDFVLQMSNLFAKGDKFPILNGCYDSNVYTRQVALQTTLTNRRRIVERQAVKSNYYDTLYRLFSTEVEKLIFNQENIDNIANGSELFFQKEVVSVSKIEEFYACPYKHYLRYGLDLQPRKVSELQPNDYGSILHATLEKFIDNIDINESDMASKTRAKQCFKQVMADDYYRGISKDIAYKYNIIMLEGEAVKMCLLVKEQLQHSHFVNFKAEMKFGLPNAPIDAIEIEAGGKIIKLHGIVDRIDTYGKKSIIIDYKSGSNVEFNENLLYMGKKLQLLVYLYAVMSKLGYEPVGYYYFKLHDDFISDDKKSKSYTYIGRTLSDKATINDIDTDFLSNGKSERLGVRLKKDNNFAVSANLLTATQIQAQINYALDCIKRAGVLMQEGFISITPVKGTCDYCDYKEICGVGDIYNIDERKVAKNVKAHTIEEIIK